MVTNANTFRSAIFIYVIPIIASILLVSLSCWLSGILFDVLNPSVAPTTSQNFIITHPDLSLFSNISWNPNGNDRGIHMYTKNANNSKLIGIRGESIVDVHISNLLGVFFNTSLSYEWIDFLKSIDVFDYSSSSNHDILHEVFKLPFPLKDRDVVLLRNWSFNSTSKVFTVLYRSIEDSRFTASSSYVRVVVPYTQWKFTAIPPEKSAPEVWNCTEMKMSVSSLSSKSRIVEFFKRLAQKASWFFKIKVLDSSLFKKKATLLERKTKLGCSRSNTHSVFRSNRTLIEFESVIDSDGLIPLKIRKIIQTRWLAKAFSSLVQVTNKKLASSGGVPSYNHTANW